MDSLLSAQQELLENLLEAIPVEHRGIFFERLLPAFNPQENTRKLKVAFSLLWAERNTQTGDSLLTHLLHGHTIAGQGPSPQEEFLPQTEREWRIACLVAATLIQWLPTSVGCDFLREGFKRAGGNLMTTPPLPED